MADAMQVAKTILEQLGGNKFRVMTGAKNFTSYEHEGPGLSFQLPGGGFTKSGINYVAITLTPADLYTVVFERVRKLKRTPVAKFEDVYNDQLVEIFERETGLRTKLF